MDPRRYDVPVTCTDCGATVTDFEAHRFIEDGKGNEVCDTCYKKRNPVNCVHYEKRTFDSNPENPDAWLPDGTFLRKRTELWIDGVFWGNGYER